MLPGLSHVGRIGNSLQYLYFFFKFSFLFGILTMSFISHEKSTSDLKVKCDKHGWTRQEGDPVLPRDLDLLPKYLNNLVFWFPSSKLLLKSLAN